MRTDWEIARRGFARYAAYPAASIAGAFTNIVFGFVRTYILLALYQQREVIGGYDSSAAVAYVWIGQGLLMTIWTWGWVEIALRIRSGDIALDLIRPIEPLRAALAFDLGRATYHVLFRGIPPFVVGALVFTLVYPRDALAWLAFVASVALAVVVSFGFRALYNAATFWLLDVRGMIMVSGIALSLLSGFMVPVSFFPDWLAAVARATPFPSMVQTPIDIFIGRTTGLHIVAALASQLAWALVMLAAAQVVFAAGVRRLVIQGG
jgi:ABC-2 type transport system permease protein